MELTVIAFVFILGFISFLAAFIPSEIWGKLPIVAMTSGLFFYAGISGIAYRLSDNIWAASIPIIIVAVCYSWILISGKLSHEFVLGYCYGLASPFWIAVLIRTIIRQTDFSEGLLWLGAIVILTILMINWSKSKEKMRDDKFKYYQVFLSMIGVCLVGISIGIAVTYIYLLSTGNR